MVTVEQKAARAVLVLLSSFFLFAFLGALVDGVLFWGALVVPAAAAIYLSSLRCPSCHRRLNERRVRVGTFTMTYYGGSPVPKRCVNCGHPLDK